MNIQIKSRFTAAVLFDAHAEIWAPKEEALAAEAESATEES